MDLHLKACFTSYGAAQDHFAVFTNRQKSAVRCLQIGLLTDNSRYKLHVMRSWKVMQVEVPTLIWIVLLPDQLEFRPRGILHCELEVPLALCVARHHLLVSGECGQQYIGLADAVAPIISDLLPWMVVDATPWLIMVSVDTSIMLNSIVSERKLTFARVAAATCGLAITMSPGLC
jgi:hypothetical protein